MVKNQSHTLAYSLIALQEMNLAYKYPIIFWNCACLITDAGGNNEESENENEEFIEEIYNDDIENFDSEDEEEDSEDSENDEETLINKKKKKTAAVNYGKIATAIGKMRMAGIDIAPPDINDSSFTFSPDVKNNVIRYGLSGITRIGEELVKTILNNRPYSTIEDFLNKVKINKPQMINLIKCGAFDKIYNNDRISAMKLYTYIAAEPKKRLTLQNTKMLIENNLIPDEFDFNKKVFNFNSYIKKLKNNNYFLLDNIAFTFYSENFDIDLLESSSESLSGFKIKQTTWKNIYDKYMDDIRTYIKKNQGELLDKLNKNLIAEVWDKYCPGDLSKWEMDSVGCYFHNHELEKVNDDDYNVIDYFKQPDEPIIDRYLHIDKKGKKTPIFRIMRIMGTVLDRDKSKKTINLLTKTGVVTVKIYGTIFSDFDKQISLRGADGKKHIIEKSWFSRGNNLIITGLKRDESFTAKKYSSTPYSLIELIDTIDEYGNITTRVDRLGD